MSALVDRDMGWKSIKKSLTSLKGAHTKVGVQGDSKRKGDAANQVTIAIAHEFGTETIPSRSFLRSTYEEHNPKAAQLLAAEYQKILRGDSDARKSLALVGAWFQAKVQGKIRSGIRPPLKASTIARRIKGVKKVGPIRATPLWDTGQLIQGIRHVEVV